MTSAQTIADSLTQAIQAQERVRLVYERQQDGLTSVHEIAPIDIRPGDTPKTEGSLYLWAWCFAEDKAEMHLMHRVRQVVPTGSEFTGPDVTARWPANWPLPRDWAVPRDWG